MANRDFSILKSPHWWRHPEALPMVRRHPVRGTDLLDFENIGCVLKADFDRARYAVHRIDIFDARAGRRDPAPEQYAGPDEILETWTLNQGR